MSSRSRRLGRLRRAPGRSTDTVAGLTRSHDLSNVALEVAAAALLAALDWLLTGLVVSIVRTHVVAKSIGQQAANR